ncbi:hypothetical protein T492DRAFT_985370 [Pavlovales sp. CCMP2436]|nr:hypothetical protein T492DRAFT_985370 [Pavlovales sp. CCMP2436]
MSADELHDVLRETLEVNGTMSRLRASIRAQVFGALQDDNERVPRITRENLIINDLIREYLAFNHYDHALAVFMAESGQPKSTIDRRYLSEQTSLPIQGGVVGGPDGRSFVQLPLLYGVLSPPRPAGTTDAHRGSSSGQVVRLEGAAVPPTAGERRTLRVSTEDASGGNDSVPGVSFARPPRSEARALGGGAPDPLVFSR